MRGCAGTHVGPWATAYPEGHAPVESEPGQRGGIWQYQVSEMSDPRMDGNVIINADLATFDGIGTGIYNGIDGPPPLPPASLVLD